MVDTFSSRICSYGSDESLLYYVVVLRATCLRPDPSSRQRALFDQADPSPFSGGRPLSRRPLYVRLSPPYPVFFWHEQKF